MTTYTVDVRHGQRWWVLSVPAVRGAVSQARSLRDVESTARDLIAVMLDVPADSFDVVVNVVVPESVTARLNHAAALREQAAEYRDQAADETRGAARELKELGLSLRDVGTTLGVSFQRAHQLVNGN